MTLKHNLSALGNIINHTRGRSRGDIIIAVKAWEIQAREELQQLKDSPDIRAKWGIDPSAFHRLIDEILGVEPHGK